MDTYGNRPGKLAFPLGGSQPHQISARFFLLVRAIILQASYLQRVKSIRREQGAHVLFCEPAKEGQEISNYVSDRVQKEGIQKTRCFHRSLIQKWSQGYFHLNGERELLAVVVNRPQDLGDRLLIAPVAVIAVRIGILLRE
jgi:hypothetical protein